jgi:transposase
MEEQMEMRTERVDDLLVLIELIKQMDLPGILDRVIGQEERRLSWGWTISLWLVYVVSQGDHRKLPVRQWANHMHETLELATGRKIGETDFTDDRLTIALSYISRDPLWNDMEQELGKHLIRVYDLEKKTMRIDATTVSGYREGGEGSIWQFGHSKDDSTLRQIKLMMAVLDPLGLPLILDVLSGHRADDPLYLPVIERALALLESTGLLIVGDCKMSALALRASIRKAMQHYLTPLALVGETVELMDAWIEAALAMGDGLTEVRVPDGEQTKVIARGYEFKRMCTVGDDRWEERVLMVLSFAYAEKQRHTLEKRIAKAQAALYALTPPVGKGHKQIMKEEDLQERATAILKKYEVTGLLTYVYEREIRQTEKLVGPGRNGPKRERQVVEQVRYQITAVTANSEAIASCIARLGWRAYVTTAPTEQLSLECAVLEYRNEYLVERGFGRFKGPALCIAPMFVKRDDQVIGLARLLSIAVRMLTLLEGVVRRSLKKKQTSLAGLYLDSPHKVTPTPTAERMLQAFVPITLIIMSFSDRLVYRVTGLSPIQQEILDLLGFSPHLYTSLAQTIPRVSQISDDTCVTQALQTSRASPISQVLQMSIA